MPPPLAVDLPAGTAAPPGRGEVKLCRAGDLRPRPRVKAGVAAECSEGSLDARVSGVGVVTADIRGCFEHFGYKVVSGSTPW